MKRLISILALLIATTAAQAADHKGFSIGVTTSEVGGDEGSALFIASPYYFDDTLSFKMRYGEAYIEGIPTGGSTNWHAYNIANVGAMLVLMESDSMNIYFEGGVNYTEGNSTIGGDSSWGRYGHVGFEWYLNKKWVECCSAFVELGTTGKGGKADKLAGTPSFGHGFVSTIGLRYFFGE